MTATRSRDRYISQRSPIETELKTIFDTDAPLIIFDIGSCEGEDSIRYSRLFPRSQIYAVEPLPKNVERMKALLEKYAVTNVEVVPLAFSDRSGKATFYVSSGQREDYHENLDWDFGNKSSSLLPPDEHTTDLFPWLHLKKPLKLIRMYSRISVRARASITLTMFTWMCKARNLRFCAALGI